MFFGSTALHHDVSAGASPPVVERLIDAGADVNAFDDLGKLLMDYEDGNAGVLDVLSRFKKDAVETETR